MNKLMEEMEKHGIHQYEISNFARLGLKVRHNLTYWDNDEYYGIGAGAHGYTAGKRIANHGPVKKYMTSVAAMDEFPVLEEHPVHLNEQDGRRNVFGLTKNRRCFFRKL